MVDANHAGKETLAPPFDTDEGRLALLLEQVRSLVTERDPAGLLHRVAVAAREITRARMAGVAIVGENGRHFEHFVTVGLDDALIPDLRKRMATAFDCPARRVIETGEVVNGTNPGGDPRVLCLPATLPPIHSFLFVPVAAPSRVYGWLALTEKEGAHAFSEVDALLATTLATQAGVVYENARLEAQLRAQAEALREHDEQTEFAMSAGRIGVSYRDLGSQWIVMSRSTVRILGLPEEYRRISQDEMNQRTHPDDRPRLRAAIEKAIREGSEFTLDFRMFVSDAVRWFQFSGRVVADGQGNATRLVGVLADITERRTLELQLRQAQKMEAVGQLAGGVAHDFNNLLTAIAGYARFALDSAVVPEQRRDIEEIVKAAGRASALTKQLLSFSRRHFMEAVSIDLNALIVDMVMMLKRVIGEDVELTTALGADLSTVRADRSQLEQVVMNLVINARDATGSGGDAGSGGAIQIETSTATFDAGSTSQLGLKAGTYVTLTVSDNGCGMSEDTKARLFEPFFTTKPRGQGTGLGLATVYGIVTQNGGAIQVESELGTGSTFTVYLPSETGPAHVAERHAEPQRATGSATVLLVEDEQAVRELVRIILERAGYSVVEAANADEAETLFGAMRSLDLLISDVVMPGRSGFELFHQLHDKQESLRVLFISGYTDYATFDSTIAERELAFLEKPFSAEGLVAKVRDVLSH